ncbi:hypothetical protein [Leisingera sp. F5]|uniref:hypothetical protein n=1 Tax=Leisingera sp. F5 TaxID=1813816 RepID=UPI000B04A65D|nr:hypothetical protein [Leisingera sp. F5]
MLREEDHVQALASKPHSQKCYSIIGRGLAVGSRFALTVADRAGIERLLRQGGLKSSANPELLAGFLRHKLRISRGAPEPAPEDLVTAGCEVVYMTNDGVIRSGLLTFDLNPKSEHVPVETLLGATLIGMQMLQKAPLLRDSGDIDAVVVIDVKPAPGRANAPHQ